MKFTKQHRRHCAETFAALRARGCSGKSAAQRIGISQATLNRWESEFRSAPLIEKSRRLQVLKDEIHSAVRLCKFDVTLLTKKLQEAAELKPEIEALGVKFW
jgi:transcriptional regulator with XRE-family HTH domain